MKLTKEKVKGSYSDLKDKLNLSNPMQAPRIEKVVISSGVGSFSDKNKIKIVEDRLAKITGQKPIQRGAKQSIATFKSREGDIVGIQVTLRGEKMWSFLDRLLNTALPRTKDFRGLPETAIDNMGNMTMSIREHTVFPETADEDLKDVFGFAVTIVTNFNSREKVEAFFRSIGFPFRKK